MLGIAGCLAPALLNAAPWLIRGVAETDLSLGRLIEGHVNALELIDTWGSEALRAECRQNAERGHLFGVWGADDVPPVTADNGELRGAKRFASGLGTVTRALVTANTPDGQRLFLVAADDPARHDLSDWVVSGMATSRSGRFDCEGLSGTAVGPADIYTREPHFVGGTWRIAAVSLGGIVGLLDRAGADLRARGRLEAEAQLLRLSPIAGRSVAAWPAILRASRIAGGPTGAADPERAAILSVSTRLLTEELAQDAITAVERSVGLSMFSAADPVGRTARDLACYVRQAAPDAFALRTGRAFLGQRSLGDWLDD